MRAEYEKCARQMREIAALAQTAGLLSWDQEAMMPERAIEARAKQSEAISAAIHEKLTDRELGDSLLSLASDPAGLAEDERVCVREWLRDHEKSAKLPEALVRELASTASLSQEAWARARTRRDFSIFSPWLEKTVDLKRRQAECMGYALSPYDALLDDYEPHMTCAALSPLMENLRLELVPMVAAIADSKRRIAALPIGRKFPEAAQEKLSREVMAALGLDLRAARLDRSAHPFCCGMAPTDVRITTRYDERLFTQSLYGVIHESGHALYEQGLPEERMGTPLCEAVSLGIHESQSRFWENVVGRSMPFVRFILPRLRRAFGSSMRGVRADAFYRAINRVEPSLIRVEADEVTYNLHVVLRYEIEKALIEGDVSVAELPALWNERMKAYMGLVPEDDSQGLMQDIHWSAGLFGYFPTYALGNLYSAQWWNAIKKDVRGTDAKIAAGEFGPILAWLRKNIHRHGRRYSASELVLKATGEPLGAGHFTGYLRKKFGDIYGIRW